MPLEDKQKRFLKSRAHALKPVVMVGQNGISDTVLEELERALDHHELVKVKVNAGDRDLRDEMVERMRASTKAELVQRIGNVAVYYRHNPKKKQPLELPS